MLLNREKLLVPAKFEIEKVVLGTDETGEESFVYVRQMSAAEKDVLEQSILKPKHNQKGEFTGYDQDMSMFRAKLAVATICDEKGTPILKPEDYTQFAKSITAKLLEQISEVANRLNGVSIKNQDDLLKNLNSDQTDDSNSASAEN